MNLRRAPAPQAAGTAGPAGTSAGVVVAGSRRGAGLAWLVAAVSLVAAANVMSCRHLLTDSFYDLYSGRYIVAHGIPRVNVVTVASHGAPWIDQQWLAHVLCYAAWALGGYAALAALSAALATAGYAVLGLLLLRRGVPPVRVFAWTLVAFLLSLGSTGIRAQSFGYLFFALTLWLVAEDDRAPRPRAATWLLVPVLVLWANAHGSVLAGAGLAGLYSAYRVAKALARRDRAALAGYVVLGALSVSSVLCTPYGPGVIGYYRSLIGNPALARFVAEWASPGARDPLSWALYGLAVADAVVVALAVRRGARPDPLLCGIAAVLLAVALTSFRGQPWFGFGGSLLAADTLARVTGGRAPELRAAFRRVTAGALALLALAAVGVLAAEPDRMFTSGLPLRAISVAAKVAAGNPGSDVLADWSATPMLWLHPAMFGRVGFDSRLEQYAPADVAAFAGFLLAEGPRWQRVTRGYDLIVLARRGYPELAGALSRLPGWHVVYEDADGVVFARRGFPPRPAALSYRTARR